MRERKGKGREKRRKKGRGDGESEKKKENDPYCALIVCCTLCNTKRVACSPKKGKGGIMHS